MSKKIFTKVFKKIRGAITEAGSEVKRVSWKEMKAPPALKDAKALADDVADVSIKKATSNDMDMRKLNEVLEASVSKDVRYVEGNRRAIVDKLEKTGQIIDDISHHIDEKSVKLMRANPKGFAENGLSEAMNRKARDAVYRMRKSNLEADLIGLYGQKFKSVITPKVDAAKSLQGQVEILNKFHRTALNSKHIGVKGTGWEALNNEMTSVFQKTNAIYNLAVKKGNIPLANQTVLMLKGFEFGDIANAKIKNISDKVTKELKTYDDDVLMRIEAYINKADFTKTEPLTTLGGGLVSTRKKSIDRALAKQLNLDDKMVSSANKVVQKNRISAMMVQESETRSFNVKRFERLDADGVYIQSDLLVNMGVKGKIGDLGANYTPLVPTEAYSEQLKKINHSEWQMIDRHFSGDSHSFKKRRSWESNLSKDPSLRMNLADAGEKHTSSVIRNSSKTTQEQLIIDAANLDSQFGALLTASGGVAGSKAEIAASMERTKSKFLTIWNEVQMSHAPRMKTRETDIEKFGWGIMDVFKTVAIARPNQAAHNALQPLVTNTAVPYSKILVEYAKQTPKFMKEFVVGVSKFGDIDNVVKHHTKRLDPNSTLGYNTRRYFSEMGNQNLSTEKIVEIDKINGFLGNGMGKVVSDMLTYMFRGSDAFARSVLFSASTKHFESGMKKFGHLKGKDNIAFVRSMQKHLNLSAIHGNDIQIAELSRKLLHSDVKEPAYLFSKITTNHALFDYRPLAKPMFTKRGRASDAHSAATVFTSWSLYNSNVVKSYLQAASNGNMKPLLGLGTMAGVWYYGMSELTGSDNYFVSNFGRKGVSRTPGMSAILAPYEMISRPLGGMMVSPLAAATSLFVEPMAKLNDRVSKKDKFDFLSRELGKSQDPLTGLLKEIGNVYGQF